MPKWKEITEVQLLRHTQLARAFDGERRVEQVIAQNPDTMVNIILSFGRGRHHQKFEFNGEDLLRGIRKIIAARYNEAVQNQQQDLADRMRDIL